jgi:hypothetical protein
MRGEERRRGQAARMDTPPTIRVLIIIVLMAIAVDIASQPALSYNYHGLWVGTLKRFAANHTQIAVYSSENRRELLFILPPNIPITSADGTHHYSPSDLKVGALVRVHVNMPWDFGYYGYGATVGATYVTRIDLLTGAAIHRSIQKSLQETLPSPTPLSSPTSAPPVPIIFVSPSP